MGRMIAVTNQKGGVGKTTTAVNLGASLAVAEKKVLLIDFDPQGNASSGVGVSLTPEKNIYGALINDEDIHKAIYKTNLPYLDILPSNADLAGAELELVSTYSRETKLKRILEPLRELYDYLIIDCPPSLGLLTINALTAADSYIVPLQCEYYALEGLSQLLKTVDLIRDNLNPRLEKEGILLTMFDGRNNLSHQVKDEVVKHFGDKVFASIIPRNVRLSEAPSFGKPIILYDSTSRGCECYLDLAQEVIARVS